VPGTFFQVERLIDRPINGTDGDTTAVAFTDVDFVSINGTSVENGNPTTTPPSDVDVYSFTLTSPSFVDVQLYQLDFTATAVSEPTSLVLLAAAVFCLPSRGAKGGQRPNGGRSGWAYGHTLA